MRCDGRLCYNVLHQRKGVGHGCNFYYDHPYGADEKSLINDYAKTFGMTASEFVRTAVLEHIEDELDLRDWYAAKAEFDADPTIYTADEIAKKYL